MPTCSYKVAGFATYTHIVHTFTYIDISMREVFLCVVFHEQRRVITDQTVPVVSETELSILATCT